MPMCTNLGYAWLCISVLVLSATPCVVRSDEALCDQAAHRASEGTGVPVSVLQAVTRVETGRGGGAVPDPWPWAVNVSGAGHWFDTADLALAFAFRTFKSGVRNFDVGCFQINYRWHGAAFQSIEAMFDPDQNALYAAQFLKALFAEFGDWEAAAGAYHSRTKIHADRYKRRFSDIHTQIDEQLPQLRTAASSGPGALISIGDGARIALGSLVALSDTRRDALIDLN